jgi:hypothetical protein
MPMTRAALEHLIGAEIETRGNVIQAAGVNAA